MSRVLCTFSGKFGDILWSLPTVRAISQVQGCKVDFGMMPDYSSLIPLLAEQPYIMNAFVIRDWVRLHSNYGDQPWLPPNSAYQAYDHVFHLTYRGHPGISAKRLALIDFIADQQGFLLKDPIPFLSVSAKSFPDMEYVAYCFNEQYVAEKKIFFTTLTAKFPDLAFINTEELDWVTATATIRDAVAFVGCKSANYVLAHGVGQKNIFVYDPHPSRNVHGHLGDVFSCPYNAEYAPPPLLPPIPSAEIAASYIERWLDQKKKEELV